MSTINEAEFSAPRFGRRRRWAAVATVAVLAGAATLTTVGWSSGAGANDADWTTPSFASGAGDVRDLSGIDYNPVGYKAGDGDRVEFRGVIGPSGSPGIPAVQLTDVFYGQAQGDGTPGPFGAKLFTLPCGLRPEHITLAGGSAAADTFGKNFDASGVAVMPNGDVYAATYVAPFRTDDGGAFQLSFLLDNLSFHADGNPDDCGGVPATTTTAEETTTTLGE